MPAKRGSHRLCNHTTIDYTFVHRDEFEGLQESFGPVLHLLIPGSSEILLRKIAGPAKSP